MSDVLRNLVANYIEDNSELLNIDSVINAIDDTSNNMKNITVNIYFNSPREKNSNVDCK